MSIQKFSYIFMILSIFAVFFSVSPVFTENSQEFASITIGSAEKSILSAYEGVLDAEGVGANVSGLLVKLNDATGLLSEARMAFDVGNFEESTRLAKLSSEIGSEVVSEAERLEVEANYANVNRSGWFSAGSVLGVSTVLIASFFGVRYFKNCYYRRLLKMKPRVEQV